MVTIGHHADGRSELHNESWSAGFMEDLARDQLIQLVKQQQEQIAAFGVDTQRLLRLEKGHLIFGQDTDGTTNPYEVNLGWGVRLSKPRFNGKHSLTILKPKLSRKLVGFKTSWQPGDSPIEECHLVIETGPRGANIAGRVTSVSFSPSADAIIGLAMVDLPLTEVGTTITIRKTDGALVEANVVATPFYDPDKTISYVKSIKDGTLVELNNGDHILNRVVSSIIMSKAFGMS